MRRSILLSASFSLGLSFALCLTPLSSALAKSVLVPSGETSSGTSAPSSEGGWASKLPNLGLGKIFSGKDEEAGKASSPEPSQKTESAPLLPNKPAGASNSAGKAAPTLTDALTGMPGLEQGVNGITFPKNTSMTDRMSSIIKMRDNYMNNIYHRPPTIIPDTDVDLPEEMTQNFSNRVNVTLSEAYVWSKNDVSRITSQLGHEAKDIQKNCQLRIVAMFISDGGSVSKGLMAGHKAVVPYQGTLQSINIMSKAVCTKPAAGLPNNSQIIESYKGFYQAPIGFGSACNPPTGRFNEIVIQYQGDGQPNCVFR